MLLPNLKWLALKERHTKTTAQIPMLAYHNRAAETSRSSSFNWQQAHIGLRRIECACHTLDVKKTDPTTIGEQCMECHICPSQRAGQTDLSDSSNDSSVGPSPGRDGLVDGFPPSMTHHRSCRQDTAPRTLCTRNIFWRVVPDLLHNVPV